MPHSTRRRCRCYFFFLQVLLKDDFFFFLFKIPQSPGVSNRSFCSEFCDPVQQRDVS